MTQAIFKIGINGDKFISTLDDAQQKAGTDILFVATDYSGQALCWQQYVDEASYKRFPQCFAEVNDYNWENLK
jgi:hypothetical protein